MWDWLLSDLRNLCRTSGMSHEDLARTIRRSRAHVSNILAGRRALRQEDARLIDQAYRTGDRYQLMIHWASKSHDSNWFGQYVEYERVARSISSFQGMTIPGLLQTPEYSQALIKTTGASEDVDAAVARRMERQSILTGSDPPLLWVVVTESVIDWPVGKPADMRRQLAHLLDSVELPNVGLRVIERSAGAHAGADGSFSLISGSFGEVAYTDSPGAGRLVTDVDEVSFYRALYNRIGQAASSEKRSLEIIYKAMEAL